MFVHAFHIHDIKSIKSHRIATPHVLKVQKSLDIGAIFQRSPMKPVPSQGQKVPRTQWLNFFSGGSHVPPYDEDLIKMPK